MELLKKENIILNCKEKSKDEMIRDSGQLLYKSGYVDESYIDGMLEREKTFSTNIGNGIAIPHGVEEAKKDIKHSGLSVMVYPDGAMWNDELVYVVVGIAAVGDEHLDILANIAMAFSDEDTVKEIVKSDVDTIYNVFVGEE